MEHRLPTGMKVGIRRVPTANTELATERLTTELLAEDLAASYRCLSGSFAQDCGQIVCGIARPIPARRIVMLPSWYTSGEYRST